MSKSRDYIAEILSLKGRLKPETPRYSQTLPRLINIDEGLEHISTEIGDVKPFKQEFIKYIPVACVACIEGYFRLVYRDLIDYGSPYCDNISALKDIRFNIESVIAIQGRKVSLGEFVSHLLPANRPDDINKNMSLIIGEDFFDRLKQTEFIQEDGSVTSIAKRGEEAWLFDGLKELFELRHIFCHELALAQEIDQTRAITCFGVSLALTLVTEYLVEELLV